MWGGASEEVHLTLLVAAVIDDAMHVHITQMSAVPLLASALKKHSKVGPSLLCLLLLFFFFFSLSPS